MDGGHWIQLLIAALGGGVTVKLLDILYQEIRRRSERSQSAKEFVDAHLDPLLKAADELVGKLRAQANEDFKSLRKLEPAAPLTNNDMASLVYLFARLWANIEVIRQEGLSVSLVDDVRGKRLQDFMDCMESRRVRIVDRISQRAVGELMLSRHNEGSRMVPFIEFVRLVEHDADAQRWISGVVHVLSRTQHTRERQRLLQYGAIVHAMVDTLDPEHKVTKWRPSYPNKLSKKSWRDLKYRVFGQYLKFVPEPQKYLGPPKRGGPKSN